MIFLGTTIGSYSPPYIVAEISGNHGGKIDRAFKLIEEAKYSGANAVKIQCYTADDLTLPFKFEIKGGNPWHGKHLYELYMETCTPHDWIPQLFEHAKKVDIPIFSSVYSTRGLEELTKVGCRAFKIASFEAHDLDFIRKVVAVGKPVVISTGTLNDIEIDRLDSVLPPDNSTILHCVSKYPCDISDLSLANMRELQRETNYTIGFSCHSDNPVAVVLAAVNKAAMIELHLVLDDDEGKQSSDYEFSFTPETLKYTVGLVKDSLRGHLRIKDSQDADSRKLRRSLYVIKDVKKGETFTNLNIGSYRPNLGCEPYLLPNIIGRKANQDIKQYTPMSMEFIK